MDIVITYVNGLDPQWQSDYERHTSTPVLEKRFRDWGTLKYLFRGIEVNMPWIRKVHLVVSGPTQVPKWVNRDEVNVVYHSDIIPTELLPTFNSNTIEMHLHRIEGLDEEFLYFNDDIFPVDKCRPTDFFRDGRGVIGMSRHLLAFGMFKKICRNSDRLARRALGMKTSPIFMRQQHICAPMLRTESQNIYTLLRDEILSSLTRTRTASNPTQYLFIDYMYHKGLIINERISKQHFSAAVASIERIERAILSPRRRLICINDVKLSDERYVEMNRRVKAAFERRFPDKSKYEKP